ncbi:DUF6223 family protein [Micromonospora sp. CB01531]|uniref:DUF6223 family protein n=1 Tax=Micromonospora sp. CB01531 TaxID=1718947 RepID=UPI00093BA67B|nr:DUF6223 family protein [Micromonospora sp. CB01531]OKI53773.1 hypothetical protein A6A27_32160 [Micromonospora sp. CB01531]
MSVRHLLAAAAAALLGVFGLATPAAAHVLAEPATVYGWTPERIWGSAAALLALVGVVIGGLALARPASRVGNGGRGAIVALVAGLIAVVNGALVVVTADGGLGTGNGIAGGYLALVIGLIATALGWLALARSRRTV